MGRIFLNSLGVNAIIGTLPAERLHRQRLVIDLEIVTDMRKAAVSDNLSDAVDYSEIESKVVTMVENSDFFLLEALAGAIGKEICSNALVSSCVVRITKASATRYGKSAAIELAFGKGGEIL